ncbi:MAG: YggS family pyridoxal phosphate enzyme [Acidimicrobiales bacterium]
MAVTATMLEGDIAERLDRVRRRIVDAGGSLDGMRIVAVTKGFGAEAVEAVVAAGLHDVGENYAQELEAKLAGTAARGVRWHFVGHVQRNKVKRIAAGVHLWQAVDRLSAGVEIARRAPGAAVLLQVNASGDPAKHGCDFEAAPALVEALAALDLDVRGLMAVGPAGDPELARPGFRRVVELADHLGLPERSIGMTDDLEVAVQEGSTMVRVGRALFGPRSRRPDLRP